MAIPKIIGGQRDFSAGELDESIKRNDAHPIMKIGARQMSNWRVLNSGAISNRPGRTALFLEAGRVDKVLMSPGNTFYLAFGNGYLRVYNAAGAMIFNTTQRGDGTPITWTTATVKNVVWTVLGAATLHSIIICYADGFPSNEPLDLSWDGVSQTSNWTIEPYSPSVTPGGQKRTMFYRLSPQGVTLNSSSDDGGTDLTFSSPVLYSGMVGTRLSFCGRQITITGVTAADFSTPVAGPSAYGTGLIDEPLPGGQEIGFASGTTSVFNIGDEVAGATSGAKGIVTNVTLTAIQVQLIPTSSGNAISFVSGEVVAGPGGSATCAGITGTAPVAVALWNDEVMNSYRGWPTSCFYDQGRLGFCNFPSLPSAIAWSTIGVPGDFWVDPNGVTSPSNAILELVPGKSQVLYVQPGMESSEFIFCDNALYYIPISQQQPLQPGSISFNLISEVGCYPVQPRPAEQTILYMKAGGGQVGAVQAPGAYYRPYIIDDVSELHAHLFTGSSPIAIAIPSASLQFDERYAYILLSNGSVVVGRYTMRNGLLDAGPEGKPRIGWTPWTGAGTPTWVSALQTDLIFTTSYAPNGIKAASVVEALDTTQWLDAAVPVNNPPAPFTPPTGKGPLWWLAGGAVFLIDLGTRFMGVYQIDANGNIIPQNIDGENLLSTQLVAGQTWTATIEPFAPDANPGTDMRQRIYKRRVSRMTIYVSRSTGFLMARLFAGPITQTSPPLGTIMNNYRVATWNQGDDPTKPPPLREEAQRWRPLGRAFDPRVAVIKDTPGPLLVHEFGIECSV